MRISDWSSDVCSSDLLEQTKEHAAGRWRCFSSCEWKRRRKIAAKTRIGDPLPPAKRHQIKSVRKRRYAFRHEPYPCEYGTRIETQLQKRTQEELVLLKTIAATPSNHQLVEDGGGIDRKSTRLNSRHYCDTRM